VAIKSLEQENPSMAVTVLNPEKEYEIVAGQPEEKAMGGARHGGIGARLLIRLGSYVEAHRLGGVYGPGTSFQIGSNERLPDVAFVAADRIPPAGEPEGMWPFAPDLAVDILSPTDLHERVSGKIREYFAAGVRQVWVISPEYKMLTIYQSPTQVRILTEEDELTSDEIVPGFQCRLRELFQTPTRV
jgi:Uma2 family endonuclease